MINIFNLLFLIKKQAVLKKQKNEIIKRRPACMVGMQTGPRYFSGITMPAERLFFIQREGDDRHRSGIVFFIRFYP